MNKFGGYLYKIQFEKFKEISAWLKSEFGDPLELKWAFRSNLGSIKIWDDRIRLLLILKYKDCIEEIV